MRQRTLFAALCLTLPAVQAWDSNALAAEPHVQALIALAILIGPAAVAATGRTEIQLAAVAAGGVGLVAARMLPAVHLPELLLAGVFPAMLVLVNRMRALAAARSDQAAWSRRSAREPVGHELPAGVASASLSLARSSTARTGRAGRSPAV